MLLASHPRTKGHVNGAKTIARRPLFWVCLSLLLGVLPAQAASPSSDPQQGTWHRLVGILQYLQADYPAAVESQSAFELAEQKSFAAEAVSAAHSLGDRAQTFVPRVEEIAAKVKTSSEPEAVSRLCGALVNDLVLAGGLSRSPRHPPDLAKGAALFGQACGACHGEMGDAQVAIAATMEPAPANFLDADVMDGLSPYKAFNTTSFGVPGTAMPGYPSLSEDDRWSLAFHLFTLRQPPCDHAPPRASLERLATATDAELVESYGAQELACLRRRLPDADEERALLTARHGVSDALRHADAGDFASARASLMDAYLNGLEPVEPLLRARSPLLVQKLEEAFLEMRVSAEQKSPALEKQGRSLLALLDTVRRDSDSVSSFVSVLWLTALILLREGFEASIIIAALLAMLRKMEARSQAKVVHLGWTSALVVGALAYVFGRHLMAGAQRELLEAVTALASVAMLLYAALWLNRREQMSQFMGELRQKMKGTLGTGSTLGLFTIAFTAALRESFETALFLQGLTLDSPSGVAWGVLLGAVLLTAMVLFVRKVGYRLPMKTLFKASTVLLVVTAVILLGKGLRALQEVGVLSLSPLPFFTVDWLGIYPDAFTLLPQLALSLLPLLFLAIRRRSERSIGSSAETGVSR